MVALKGLLKAGLSGFWSGHMEKYYELILHSRKDVDTKLSAKELKKRIAEVTGDHIRFAAMDSSHAAIQIRAPSHAVHGGDVDREGEGGSVAGSIHDEEERPAAYMDVDEEEPADQARDDDAIQAMHVDDSGDGWLATLGGQRLKRIKGRADGTWSYHARLGVQCPNPRHVGCHKSRFTMLLASELGRDAPLLFLRGWMAKADSLPQVRHLRYAPSVSEMRELL